MKRRRVPGSAAHRRLPRERARLLAVLGLILPLLMVVPASQAGPPGAWTDLAPGAKPGPTTSRSLTIVRSPLGALHVAWPGEDGNTYAAAVGTDGTATPPVVAFAAATGGRAGGNTLASVATPDGLHLVFSGFIPGIDPTVNSATFAVSAPLTGTPWDAGRRVLDTSGTPFAGLFPDGAPLVGAQTNTDFVIQRGLDPGTPDQTVPTGTFGLAVPTVATESGAGVRLAWYRRTAGAGTRIALQELSAQGAPVGSVLEAPDLSGKPVEPSFPDQSPAANGRVGAPGVFLAYVDTADPTKLLLWRAGEPLPVIAGTATTRVRRAVLDAAPDGQIWIAWLAENRGTTVLLARQLRADGTSLGPIVTTPLPDTGGAFASVGDLQIDGQADRLDVVIAYNGTIQHAQVAAPAGAGGISGRVIDTTRLPIALATVQVCPQPTGLCLSTQTDGTGRFLLDRLPAGRYRLEAFPPTKTFYSVVTGPVIDVTGGVIDSGDIVMRGPRPKPKGTFVSFPLVNGVPIVRRNVPMTLTFDIPANARNPKIVIIQGTDDPEAVVDVSGPLHGPAPNERSLRGTEPPVLGPSQGTTPLPCPVLRRYKTGSDLYVCEFDAPTLEPGEELPPTVGGSDTCPVGTSGAFPNCQPLEVPPLPTSDVGGDPPPPEPCPPGWSQTPSGCQLGPVPPMAKLCPPGYFGTLPYCTQIVEPLRPGIKTKRVGTTVSGYGFGFVKLQTVCVAYETTITIRDPLPSPDFPGLPRASNGLVSVSVRHVGECHTQFIDPSGFVRSTRGVGLPGAKVELLRSDSAAGPFSLVANGSQRMSPLNRRNPDRTDKTGHFGWDVISGYYRVRASNPGCTDPKRRSRKFVLTKVLPVPPPVFDLDIRLRCPPAPSSKAKPRLVGAARAGKTLRCVNVAWRGGARRYRYIWTRNGVAVPKATRPTLLLRRKDRAKRMACLVVASNKWGAGLAHSRPVRVR